MYNYIYIYIHLLSPLNMLSIFWWSWYLNVLQLLYILFHADPPVASVIRKSPRLSGFSTSYVENLQVNGLQTAT